MQKAIIITREIQGNSHPNAEALIHPLACVKGMTYRMYWNIGGNIDTEKKVPHKNVIGRMIKLLNVAIL